MLDCRCARGKHPDARHHQRESTKMPKCQGACPKRDCDQHWVNAKSRSELRVVDCEARAGGALLHGMPWGAPERLPNKTRPFLEPVRPREVGEDSGCSSEGLAPCAARGAVCVRRRRLDLWSSDALPMLCDRPTGELTDRVAASPAHVGSREPLRMEFAEVRAHRQGCSWAYRRGRCDLAVGASYCATVELSVWRNLDADQLDAL